MPKRKKNAQRSSAAPLLVLAVALIGVIWATEQITARGVGPSWLQFLFAGKPTGGLDVVIIAGHKGNDSGAVCTDGLTEAEVNLEVAKLVADALGREGMRVEIMDEFDRRLRGLRANALVSIHADSCESSFSGFKVASEEGGTVDSERLANCLWDKYEAATDLPRNYDTITTNMTNYHAFREISLTTPAAIIELGFLKSDRELLTEEPQKVANGVANGILCFLTPSTTAQGNQK
ncbi:MAG: N-acetylmuramoyl-L-alanine amidase family protein [Nitrososphaerales archaeon]